MTTSATKGKVLTAREVIHEVLRDGFSECMPVNDDDGDLVFVSHGPRCELLTAAIEARDAQQAAIHEEELREARAALDAADELILDVEVAEAALVCNGFGDVGTDLGRARRAYVDARRALGASQQTGTPPVEPDPYCELAVSEIPGFGTNRDRHHCAKLHRDKPLRGTTKGGKR